MSDSEKFGLEVAKNLGEAAKEVVINLFGPPTKELGMLFGDVIADWRAKNLVAVYQKFLKLSEALKLPPEALQRLPLGYRALVFEQSSREERASLQAIWAKLLATSLVEGYSEAHHSYAIDIQSLTPLGARILSAIHGQMGAIKFDPKLGAKLLVLTSDLVSQTDADLEASLAILLKLGMVAAFPDRLDKADLRSLNDEFGDDVGALANAVRLLMLDEVERPAFEPSRKFQKVTLGENKYLWFDMTLSPYGENFFIACVEGT